MADDPRPASEPIPGPQLLMDEVILLLIVGLVVPTVIYIAWGLLSLARVPAFVCVRRPSEPAPGTRVRNPGGTIRCAIAVW